MTQIATLRRRFTSQTAMAFLLLVFGMVAVMCSLYLPPVGEIHPSVITVFGMILIAAGAFMGIDLNFQLRQFAGAVRDRHDTAPASQTHRPAADETV